VLAALKPEVIDVNNKALRVSCTLDEWFKFRMVAWEPTFEILFRVETEQSFEDNTNIRVVLQHAKWPAEK
jgi:hypothetical protein